MFNVAKNDYECKILLDKGIPSLTQYDIIAMMVYLYKNGHRYKKKMIEAIVTGLYSPGYITYSHMSIITNHKCTLFSKIMVWKFNKEQKMLITICILNNRNNNNIGLIPKDLLNIVLLPMLRIPPYNIN